MPDKDYSKTNLVRFTQQSASGMLLLFDDTYQAIVKYANTNGFEKPKKQDLLNFMIKAALTEFKPEDFYK